VKRDLGDNILQEQLAYYRARALEYDESLQGRRRVLGDQAEIQVRDEIARARDALRRLGRFEEVLELACGTGSWTRDLLGMARRITAVDGAPEMLAMARAKVADAAAVDFVCADLFGWVPTSQYDLVMFAAWISHIPPHRLDGFLDKVRDAVRPGGYVFIVDEPAGGQEFRARSLGDIRRPLRDGRTFKIVKVYYESDLICETLRARGWKRQSGDWPILLSRHWDSPVNSWDARVAIQPNNMVSGPAQSGRPLTMIVKNRYAPSAERRSWHERSRSRPSVR
jgi:demethylmenaquinone methyltransferase/2-methoxy-6-polyprenyl-1,4-benzoquinol methylase